MTDQQSPSRGRRWWSTIRFRITAIAVLAVLAVLVVVSIGVVAAQRRLLTDSLDDTLENHAVQLEKLLSGQTPETLGGIGDDDTIAQVVAPDSTVVVSTANVAGEAPIGEAPPPGESQTIRTVDDVPGGEPGYRLLARRVQTDDGERIFYIAVTDEDVRDSTRILVRSLMVAVPFAALVLALLVWWLVGRTLRPVEAIRSEVADIDGSDLHRRVPEPGSGDEIYRLAHTMNAMLDRVEESSLRQRAFVADASHELRTPLTRIRSELEVDAARPEQADVDATQRSVLEETIALQRLVDNLLYLARSDGGASPTRRDPVDLDDVVFTEATRLRAATSVAVDTSGVAAVQIRGDADQLTRLVRNLTDNAVRHAAATVTITLAERDTAAVLTVSDDGPGIPTVDRERIFERFTRLDEARSATTGGAGLGLAIARDIAEHHGGTVVVDPTDTGARFVVTLPR